MSIQKLATALGLAALGLMACAGLAWGCAHALTTSSDLMLRYQESESFLRGENPYSLPEMVYTPPALAFYAPWLAALSPESARLLWLAMNLTALAALIVFILALWGQEWSWRLKIALVLTILASKPARAGIAMGQLHIIPLVLMLAAVWALRTRRQGWAGAFTGLALVKATMAAPFLGYLAARKQGKSLAVALGLQALAFAAVCLWLGETPIRLIEDWRDVAKNQQHRGAIDLPSLCLRAWPDRRLDGGLITLGAFAAALGWLHWRRRVADPSLLGFCFFASCVFTYHRHYDQTLLLPALAGFIDLARRSRTWITSAAAFGFAGLLIIPSHPSVAGPLADYYEPAFAIASYGFLAALMARLAIEDRRIRESERTAADFGADPQETPRRIVRTIGPSHSSARA